MYRNMDESCVYNMYINQTLGLKCCINQDSQVFFFNPSQSLHAKLDLKPLRVISSYILVNEKLLMFFFLIFENSNDFLSPASLLA